MRSDDVDPLVDPLVGQTLGQGRYEVVARIAGGGMATVYRGHDRQLDRVVAIKVPRPDLARDPGFSAQFRREARAAARLSHPNVVAVHDSGSEHGRPWIVMEHVGGQTMRQVLRAHGRLDPGAVAHLLGPVAEALDHAHQAGLVHLDVKPDNLLLAGDSVKVADFGLVRAAAHGGGRTPAATVHYCAPEVLRGGPVDGRADVYALGVLAWECLVGRPPFDGEQRQVAARQLHGRVPPPSQVVRGLPEHVDAAVRRATDPDPARRYQRPSEFAAAMGAPRPARIGQALGVGSAPPAAGRSTAVLAAATEPVPPAAGVRTGGGRRRLAAVAGTALLLIGLAAGAGDLLGGPRHGPATTGDQRPPVPATRTTSATQELRSGPIGRSEDGSGNHDEGDGDGAGQDGGQGES